MRTTSDIIEHHLRCRRDDDLNRDLLDNYSDDVVLLSYEGVHHGHEGVRKLASVLASYVSAADYRYDDVIVEDDYALLRWRAEGDEITRARRRRLVRRA